MNQAQMIQSLPPRSEKSEKSPQTVKSENSGQFKKLISGAMKKSANSRPQEQGKPYAGQTEDMQTALEFLGLAQVIPANVQAQAAASNISVAPFPSIVVKPLDQSGDISQQTAVTQAGQPISGIAPAVQAPEHPGFTALSAKQAPVDASADNATAPQSAPRLQASESVLQPVSAEAPSQKPVIAAARSPLPEKPQPESKPTEPVHVSAQTARMPAQQQDIQAMEDTARPLPANAEDFPARMAQRIVSTGALKHEFEIELYPRELGKVTVNVLFESGRATISLICENEKAQALLNTHAESIRSIVQSSTGFSATASIERSEREANSQGDFSGHNRENHGQNQPKQHRNREETSSFIQKLRLGLAGEAS